MRQTMLTFLKRPIFQVIPHSILELTKLFPTLIGTCILVIIFPIFAPKLLWRIIGGGVVKSLLSFSFGSDVIKIYKNNKFSELSENISNKWKDENHTTNSKTISKRPKDND